MVKAGIIKAIEILRDPQVQAIVKSEGMYKKKLVRLRPILYLFIYLF